MRLIWNTTCATIEEVANDDLQRIMSDAPCKVTQKKLLQTWENNSRKCFAADQGQKMVCNSLYENIDLDFFVL